MAAAGARTSDSRGEKREVDRMVPPVEVWFRSARADGSTGRSPSVDFARAGELTGRSSRSLEFRTAGVDWTVPRRG